jgi:hypothetical protein
VLLLGESGTGKEVAARAIHNANPRGQFVPIDCGSLVGTLMESELFGHVKGSFSGAAENKRAWWNGRRRHRLSSTKSAICMEMQVKLLRVVQEREFRAVGSTQWRKVDLRIIAATHRDLKIGGRGRPFPPGSVLPAQRFHHPPAAAAAPQGRHSAAGGALSLGPRFRDFSPAGRFWTCCNPTIGRATCGN